MIELAQNQTHDLGTTVDVILRDGSTLRLRPPVARDETGLIRFFHGLSDRSRYLRFHGLAVRSQRLCRMSPVVWRVCGTFLSGSRTVRADRKTTRSSCPC